MWLVAMVVGAVSWSAPPSCPSESELQARLTQVKSRVEAQVRERGDQFELTVSIDDQQRTLILASCAEALESVVFLAELAGQVPSTRRPLSTQPAVEHAVEPPPPVEEKRTPPRFHLAAIAGPEWGLFKEPVARLGLSLQVEVAWVRLFLELRGAPSLSTIRSGNDVFRVSLSLTPLFDVQTGACRLFELGRLSLGPCAQGGVGLVAAAVGTSLRSDQLVTVWTAGGGLRAAALITDFVEFHAFASARFGPQARYTYTDYSGAEVVVASTGLVGIDTGVGFGVRW